MTKREFELMRLQLFELRTIISYNMYNEFNFLLNCVYEKNKHMTYIELIKHIGRVTNWDDAYNNASNVNKEKIQNFINKLKEQVKK